MHRNERFKFNSEVTRSFIWFSFNHDLDIWSPRQLLDFVGSFDGNFEQENFTGNKTEISNKQSESKISIRLNSSVFSSFISLFLHNCSIKSTYLMIWRLLTRVYWKLMNLSRRRLFAVNNADGFSTLPTCCKSFSVKCIYCLPLDPLWTFCWNLNCESLLWAVDKKIWIQKDKTCRKAIPITANWAS